MARVVLYHSGMSNGYFICEGDAVIAVDGGAVYGKEEIEKNLRENAIDPKQIRLIIASHAHVDHTCNLGLLRKLSGAPILVAKAGAEDMEKAEMPHVFPRNQIGDEIMEFAKKQGGMPDDYLPPIKVDLTFEEEFNLSAYGVKGKIIYTPGHSLSDSCVILDSGEAILGDLMVEDDFTHGKPTIAYFGYDPDRKKANELLFKGLDKIAETKARIFYSGHGGPFTRKQFDDALAEAKEQAGKDRA